MLVAPVDTAGRIPVLLPGCSSTARYSGKNACLYTRYQMVVAPVDTVGRIPVFLPGCSSTARHSGKNTCLYTRCGCLVGSQEVVYGCCPAYLHLFLPRLSKKKKKKKKKFCGSYITVYNLAAVVLYYIFLFFWTNS